MSRKEYLGCTSAKTKKNTRNYYTHKKITSINNYIQSGTVILLSLERVGPRTLEWCTSTKLYSEIHGVGSSRLCTICTLHTKCANEHTIAIPAAVEVKREKFRAR